MISVFFVNGNSMECCDDDTVFPADYIEEFKFNTLDEIAAFVKGIEAGSRYDDTEASTFLDYRSAWECCRNAIIEYHGKKKLGNDEDREDE